MQDISFKRYRFPPEVICHAIWLYARFTLSYRDVEDLLAQRGLDISYESVRRWFLKFGRHCHVNRCRSQSSASLISSRSCGRTFPYTECFSAKALESSSVFEMTLNVEGVVDGGVDVEKSLGGSGRLESLHLSFASSHRLMRVLRPII